VYAARVNLTSSPPELASVAVEEPAEQPVVKRVISKRETISVFCSLENIFYPFGNFFE
jgi:hypothetical protein